MPFVKAQRKRVNIKIALTGPSGSGKTLSALYVARGLVGANGKIAMIDTENDSASLYSDLVEFDTCPIRPPYTVQKYTQAIREAVEAGYDVLVIDSLSHAWAGDGGLLAQKESLDSRGGSNSFTNWAGITKQHEEFKAALLNSPIHLLATMRSKQEYVVESNPSGGGRTAPRKVGLAPIQRDGMEYEFTVVYDVAMSHEAIASKDRTNLFDGMLGILTTEHGQKIRAWLETGVEIPVAAAPTEEPMSAGERQEKERMATARNAFDAVALEHNVRFESGQHRGSMANVVLGRPTDSRKPITEDDWCRAADGLHDYLHSREAENSRPFRASGGGGAMATARPTDPTRSSSPTPTAVAENDDRNGDLSDPFAGEEDASPRFSAPGTAGDGPTNRTGTRRK